MANRMVKENIFFLMEASKKDYGKMENELNGWKNNSFFKLLIYIKIA